MTYLNVYIASILFFFLMERLFPKRKGQKWNRKQFFDDLIYSIINGHYAGLLIYIISTDILLYLDDSFAINFNFFDIHLLSSLPFIFQILIGLIVKDFFSWLVHNMLHRVSFLWEFHKVHHSAEEMDFWIVMRFHWMEIIVYRTALFIPLLLLGIDPNTFLYIIFIEVFWGFFNHANIRIDIGILKYIFNSPKMHLWHHEYTVDRMNLNFGITLSCWDWIFGTVYWPEDKEPERLSFFGIEQFPSNFFKQYLYFPFKKK